MVMGYAKFKGFYDTIAMLASIVVVLTFLGYIVYGIVYFLVGGVQTSTQVQLTNMTNATIGLQKSIDGLNATVQSFSDRMGRDEADFVALHETVTVLQSTVRELERGTETKVREPRR